MPDKGASCEGVQRRFIAGMPVRGRRHLRRRGRRPDLCELWEGDLTATVASIADHPRYRVAPEPLVTKRQLAGHLAVCERTIERWQREGLPVERLWSRRNDGRAPIRYRITEVEAWLRKGTEDGH